MREAGISCTKKRPIKSQQVHLMQVKKNKLRAERCNSLSIRVIQSHAECVGSPTPLIVRAGEVVRSGGDPCGRPLAHPPAHHILLMWLGGCGDPCGRPLAHPPCLAWICSPTTTCSAKSLRKGKTQKIRRKCATVAPYLASSSLRSSFAHRLITIDTTDTTDTIDTIDTNLIGKTLPNGDTP